jgi:hypothetical protein
LIVFVDLEQRPSRHALQELVAHLEPSLRDRLEAIVIQALQMPPEALPAWRTKLNLSLEVGAITGDTDAVRWAWGAKSLPWVILTDEAHEVVAEGFAVDELDEMMVSQ